MLNLCDLSPQALWAGSRPSQRSRGARLASRRRSSRQSAAGALIQRHAPEALACHLPGAFARRRPFVQLLPVLNGNISSSGVRLSNTHLLGLCSGVEIGLYSAGLPQISGCSGLSFKTWTGAYPQLGAHFSAAHLDPTTNRWNEASARAETASDANASPCLKRLSGCGRSAVRRLAAPGAAMQQPALVNSLSPRVISI